MIKKTMMSLAVGCFLLTTVHAAGDPSAGKTKSEQCAQCHGEDGKGEPPIAGMPASVLSMQLKGFKTGLRKNKKMEKVTGNLSDEDIADLSAYYSSLK